MEAKEAKSLGEVESRGERKSLAPPRTRGKTFIADDVVSVIAHKAAEQIEGIYRIGDSNLRSWFGRHHGVEAEVGMKEAAVDLDVVAEFGYPIRDIAQDLRETVIETVERMTGRRVLEVNVNVVDVHLEGTEQRRRRQLE